MGSVGAKLSCCVVVAALLPVLLGCGGSGGSEGSGESALTVYAASSLTDAFGELKDNFEEENSGIEVRLNFAGSSALLTQLEQGAPADVFASADEAKMDDAVGDSLAQAPQTFARNRLLVIVPAGNPAGIESYRDLAKAGPRCLPPATAGNPTRQSRCGRALGLRVSRESEVAANEKPGWRF